MRERTEQLATERNASYTSIDYRDFCIEVLLHDAEQQVDIWVRTGDLAGLLYEFVVPAGKRS